MAKRKLSPEQRSKLRAELLAAVKSGRKTPEILEEVSKKYDITTITGRWYLKSIGVRPKRRGKRGRPPGSKNGLKSIAALHSRAKVAMERAKEAKRLVPRWQRLEKAKVELEREGRRVEKLLTGVSGKARKFKDRIAALVGR